MSGVDPVVAGDELFANAELDAAMSAVEVDE